MEKEVKRKTSVPIITPVNKSTTKQPSNQPIKTKPEMLSENRKNKIKKKSDTPIQKPRYKNIGGVSLAQFIKENIPGYMIPTKRIATILGFVFLAVILFALATISYGEILDGNLEIKVGVPLTFLNFGIETADKPLLMKGLIIDLIIYIFISYIIDVLISLVIMANKTRLRKQEGVVPKVYRPTNPTIADKAVKKIILKQ